MMDLIKRNDAAKLLAVNVRTVDKWRKRGVLNTYKVTGSRTVRFDKKEIEKLFKK